MDKVVQIIDSATKYPTSRGPNIIKLNGFDKIYSGFSDMLASTYKEALEMIEKIADPIAKNIEKANIDLELSSLSESFIEGLDDNILKVRTEVSYGGDESAIDKVIKLWKENKEKVFNVNSKVGHVVSLSELFSETDMGKKVIDLLPEGVPKFGEKTISILGKIGTVLDIVDLGTDIHNFMTEDNTILNDEAKKSRKNRENVKKGLIIGTSTIVGGAVGSLGGAFAGYGIGGELVEGLDWINSLSGGKDEFGDFIGSRSGQQVNAQYYADSVEELLPLYKLTTNQLNQKSENINRYKELLVKEIQNGLNYGEKMELSGLKFEMTNDIKSMDPTLPKDFTVTEDNIGSYEEIINATQDMCDNVMKKYLEGRTDIENEISDLDINISKNNQLINELPQIKKDLEQKLSNFDLSTEDEVKFLDEINKTLSDVGLEKAYMSTETLGKDLREGEFERLVEVANKENSDMIKIQDELKQSLTYFDLAQKELGIIPKSKLKTDIAENFAALSNPLSLGLGGKDEMLKYFEERAVEVNGSLNDINNTMSSIETDKRININIQENYSAARVGNGVSSLGSSSGSGVTKSSGNSSSTSKSSSSSTKSKSGTSSSIMAGNNRVRQNMLKSTPKTGSIQHFRQFANGGILSDPIIGQVAEDGPESIIPLSGKRKSRGIQLWEQTGKILGVLSDAYGSEDHGSSNPFAGLLSGFTSPGIPETTESISLGSISEQNETNPVNINVNVSPTFAIEGSDAGEGNVVQVVKEHIREMADDIGDEIAERLEKVFSNMPLKEA